VISLAGLSAALSAAEGYAVRVTATVQSSPPQITLQWPAEAATSFSVSRKSAGAAAWGAETNLPGNATSYTDTAVSVGARYEYRVIKRTSIATGYGYIMSGIEAPLIDQRGRVIVVVDNSQAGQIAGELQTFLRNLVGDGWTVARIDVSPSDSPASVRDRIRAEYNSDRANTRAVLLLGRIPAVRSGNLNVDGHGARPLPSDAFYGDMDGNWPDANGDGVLDPSTLPSDVELQVGRVDFSDLPGAGSESALLRQYLNKNHAFRHANRRPARRALIGDRFGPRNGEAPAASAFRAFPALVGNGSIAIADTSDNAAPSQRWISFLAATDYLWVFGGGAGSDTSIGYLGTRGQFSDVLSADLVQLRAKGTFYLLFGSWFMDWTKTDNILRTTLAVPDHGLISAWSGRPHLFFHPMGLGETAGYAIRLSQNNTTHYTNQVNQHTRGIHIALMGDPTLRQHIVAPPGNLTAQSGAAVSLAWGASRDAVAGYHVYRATNPSGPYTRLTSSPVGGMSFTDSSAPSGNLVYMVRAVKLELTPSGSYYNASQGAFADATSTGGTGSSPPPAPAPSSSPTPSQTPSPTPVSAPAPAPVSGGDSGGGGGAPSAWALAALGILLLVRRALSGDGTTY
jgi:hypothetical protein